MDLIFAPTATDIYPDGLNKHSYVEVPELSTLLEGANRPGHFRGISTIVSKLFNVIQPDVACFGEKDYQQITLIRKMVMDMGYPINIIGVPTVRAKTGLALSSCNDHLTQEECKLAPHLHKIMNELAQTLSLGERQFDNLLANAAEKLQTLGFKSEELFMRDAETLQSINSDSKKAIILAAAWLGKVRLIDNQQVDLLE